MLTMSNYDLYGINAVNMFAAKSIEESLLNIQLEEHDSSYHAGVYFRWGDRSSEHFVLKANQDPFDDEPAELAFPTFEFLFYVNDTRRSDGLNAVLLQNKNVNLLRRSG